MFADLNFLLDVLAHPKPRPGATPLTPTAGLALASRTHAYLAAAESSSTPYAQALREAAMDHEWDVVAVLAEAAPPERVVFEALALAWSHNDETVVRHLVPAANPGLLRAALVEAELRGEDAFLSLVRAIALQRSVDPEVLMQAADAAVQAPFPSAIPLLAPCLDSDQAAVLLDRLRGRQATDEGRFLDNAEAALFLAKNLPLDALKPVESLPSTERAELEPSRLRFEDFVLENTLDPPDDSPVKRLRF